MVTAAYVAQYPDIASNQTNHHLNRPQISSDPLRLQQQQLRVSHQLRSHCEQPNNSHVLGHNKSETDQDQPSSVLHSTAQRTRNTPHTLVKAPFRVPQGL